MANCAAAIRSMNNRNFLYIYLRVFVFELSRDCKKHF
jgi:hypothetical protein